VDRRQLAAGEQPLERLELRCSPNIESGATSAFAGTAMVGRAV
jgi:hypothetical protein